MSHNNSYGNYAGSYLNQCLPNIVFAINGIFYGDDYTFYCGDGSKSNMGALAVADSYTSNTRLKMGGCTWQASNYESRYKDSCYFVRPKSYVVYMWVRTS